MLPTLDANRAFGLGWEWVSVLARSDKHVLVVAFDHMASVLDGAFSGEFALMKGREIGGSWVVMFAGDDITPANPIIRTADYTLDPQRTRTDFYSYDEVSIALRSAYQEERIQRAHGAHMSIYGIGMATFRTEGIATFGEGGA